MRTTATIILLAVLAVVADVTAQSADRVREAARIGFEQRIRVATEDWEYPIYLAVGLAICAVGWVSADRATAASRFGRLIRPPARGGTLGAVLGGIFAPLGFVVLSIVAGEGRWMQERFEWESRGLMGSALGAVAGMAIGGGLGLVACLTPVQRYRETAERN
jgi:hypothetical protein